MEKIEVVTETGKNKWRTCVNFSNIKDIVEEEEKNGYRLISIGKSDTLMGTGNIKRAGNFLVAFEKEE